MKHLLIISIFFFNALVANAQHRFSAGIVFSSQLSQMKITHSNTVFLKNSIYDQGGVAPGFSVGAQVEYSLNSDFFIRSGLAFEKAADKYLIKGLVFPTDLMNGTKSSGVNNSYIYAVDIPLDFGYRIATSRKNLNILIGVGGIAHIVTGTEASGYFKHDIIANERRTSIDNQISPASFSAVFFGGVEYTISQRLVFGIEPFLKYTPNKYVLDIYKSEAETSIQFGLSARLKIR